MHMHEQEPQKIAPALAWISCLKIIINIIYVFLSCYVGSTKFQYTIICWYNMNAGPSGNNIICPTNLTVWQPAADCYGHLLPTMLLTSLLRLPFISKAYWRLFFCLNCDLKIQDNRWLLHFESKVQHTSVSDILPSHKCHIFWQQLLGCQTWNYKEDKFLFHLQWHCCAYSPIYPQAS